MISVSRHDRPDPKQSEQWAAEHLAVEMGILRECPYHGEPYRAIEARPKGPYVAFARHDPLAAIFRGDADAMLSAVERVALAHGTSCRLCEREAQVDPSWDSSTGAEKRAA